MNSSKKDQTRQRILASAGQGIRQYGYGGIGVDGIAKSAGVTSGAFYAHFGSKEKLFEAAVESGMKSLIEGVYFWRDTAGENWLMAFVDWYLGLEHRQDVQGGCALAGLSVDVARSKPEVHQAYEVHITVVAKLIADTFNHGDESKNLELAWAILAILSGGVVMSRAVASHNVAMVIANANKLAIEELLDLHQITHGNT
jgi:TetR/AcrR family transcriptional regulator, transcriptional repressor for nem operon